MAARSRPPPGRAVSHRVGAAAIRWRHASRPAARIPVARPGRPGDPQQLAQPAGSARSPSSSGWSLESAQRRPPRRLLRRSSRCPKRRSAPRVPRPREPSACRRGPAGAAAPGQRSSRAKPGAAARCTSERRSHAAAAGVRRSRAGCAVRAEAARRGAQPLEVVLRRGNRVSPAPRSWRGDRSRRPASPRSSSRPAAGPTGGRFRGSCWCRE